MKYLLIILLFPIHVYAETWVCKQNYPDVPEAKNLLYKFDITNNVITWKANLDYDFKIVKKTDKYIYALTETYFDEGSMYTLILNKQKKYFVLNNNDATGNYTNINKIWEGPCEIVK